MGFWIVVACVQEFCAPWDWKKNAIIIWKVLSSPLNILLAYLLSCIDIYSTQNNKLMPSWIIKLSYRTSGWEPRSALPEFLDKTSSEILSQWRRWLWVKYNWAMLRVDKLWNVWVKEVALVHSPFPVRSALFSIVQCISLFRESYSKWFIYSFSITERSSQTELMPILFLQSITHPDFPFRRAKRNKVKKKKHGSLGGWKFIIFINTKLNK